MNPRILIALALLLGASGNLVAQTKVSDSLHQIVANVDNKSGIISILCAGKNNGTVNLDPSLNFFGKNFFSVNIGTFLFTNDTITKLGTTGTIHDIAHPLDSFGVTTLIKDTTGLTDTIRTVFNLVLKGSASGVSIIQDVWCIPLEVPATLPATYWYAKPAQVVISWKCRNATKQAWPVSCQWLNDIQASDPYVSPGAGVHPNSNVNDGPKMLTKWQYDSRWTQFPNNAGQTIPWFYAGFLWDLPGGVALDPGIAGMGYMDYGAPLNTLKPIHYTNGDWATLAFRDTQFQMGANYSGNTAIGGDNAILLEWPLQSVLPGKTVLLAKTSYGTGDYERCIGQLFSLVFYPHHLSWNTSAPGSYTPNPIHIEKFVVNPTNGQLQSKTKITLTVSDSLAITDSLCKADFGKSQTKPLLPASGLVLAPGAMGYFDWWVCASQRRFCKGPVTDTLSFTGTCSSCNPIFTDQWGKNIGSIECDMPLVVDCADEDVNPPGYSDTVTNTCDSITLHVHDWRTTDDGLSSATWKPTPNSQTDTNHIIVTGPFPPIAACDKNDHVFYIIKRQNFPDTLKGGCYDFTFTDCIGNVRVVTICAPVCPDTLPPVYTLVSKTGASDSNLKCKANSGDNFHFHSFTVADSHPEYSYDTGIDTIEVISSANMTLTTLPFQKGYSFASFVVSVIDTLQNGNICIRTYDMAKPRKSDGSPQGNYSDTCVYYCPDTLAHLAVPTVSGYSISLKVHPNPFTSETTLDYSVASEGVVKLSVYDILGREIANLVTVMQRPGSYKIAFDAANLSGGSYIVRLETGGTVISRKINLEK